MLFSCFIIMNSSVCCYHGKQLFGRKKIQKNYWMLFLEIWLWIDRSLLSSFGPSWSQMNIFTSCRSSSDIFWPLEFVLAGKMEFQKKYARNFRGNVLHVYSKNHDHRMFDWVVMVSDEHVLITLVILEISFKKINKKIK